MKTPMSPQSEEGVIMTMHPSPRVPTVMQINQFAPSINKMMESVQKAGDSRYSGIEADEESECRLMDTI